MSKINIMIVDDHIVVREGIKKILEKTEDIEVIAEAGNGISALDLIPIYKPDIILLDIIMPELNGIDTLKSIKSLDGNNKVIILSSYSNKEYVINTVKIGANGYLTKKCKSKDLLKAIYSVNKNNNYLDPSLAMMLGNTNKEIKISDEISRLELLSDREYEILDLLAKGYTNREIGKELFISDKTVKNHITSIYKKIRVKDRVGAVIYSYECGLTSVRNLRE